MALQTCYRRYSLLLLRLGNWGKGQTFSSCRPGKLLTFEEVGELHRKQAKQSLLVQVQSVNSAVPLESYLEQYGTIIKMFHFKTNKKLDAQLLRHYELTRLTELGARLRYFTCELLERGLAGLFPHARVRPFGSSANGFGRYGCDVDMVLELEQPRPAEAADRLAFQAMATKSDSHVQRHRYLSVISDLMANLMPGCEQVRRILRAKVPIIKFTQSLTGVDCDLCMKRSGLHMAELLYIWDQLDGRVAPLVRAVRHWAEKVRLTNAISGSSGAGRWISNFGVTLLVIYFLQTRPVPILPSVNELMRRARPCDAVEVDGTVYSFLRDPNLLPPTTNTETLSQLLAGFFAFYAEQDVETRALSVVSAGDFPRPADSQLYVQNPLDHELNVTKNVSAKESRRLGVEALQAVRLLEEGRWWPLLLGGADAGQLGQALCAPFSLRALFDDAETEQQQGAAQESRRGGAKTEPRRAAVETEQQPATADTKAHRNAAKAAEPAARPAAEKALRRAPSQAAGSVARQTSVAATSAPPKERRGAPLPTKERPSDSLDLAGLFLSAHRGGDAVADQHHGLNGSGSIQLRVDRAPGSETAHDQTTAPKSKSKGKKKRRTAGS
ncbi:poly(A) RNA polymerase, mitochondrial-like isoform X2 [Pollicipes pollicipes]|uniref:poly(A) RNA polymerase, mitochondrial-like isoform X2 n=1 Tax=Pollicipes pollicipes TaxID=41117 RepID=UPI001884F3B5|nr:poly(A) RNA polymerase, mitochondrial-like isoform X2 [Pollicipes pollicipes]